MAEKAKKQKGKVRKILEWVFLSIFGVAAAFMMVATIDGMVHKKDHYGQSIRFGIGTFKVQTDSMEPDIMVGDMIITKAEDVTKFKERLDNGETIYVTFFNIGVNDRGVKPDDPTLTQETTPVKYNMTHKLEEVHEFEDTPLGQGRYIFVASGINDQSQDWKLNQYQMFTEKEYLGTVKVTNSTAGKIMQFVSSPLGLIILLLIPAAYLIAVSSIDIDKAVKEEETNENNAKLEGDHLSNLSDKERERLKSELLDEMMKSKKGGKKNE